MKAQSQTTKRTSRLEIARAVMFTVAGALAALASLLPPSTAHALPF